MYKKFRKQQRCEWNTHYSPSMRSRWLDTGQVQFLHFYAPGLSPGPKEPKKNKKKEWGSTLIRIKNDLLIFILFFSFVFFGFCSIITSWQSFTFSLFWLSSAPFCSSIAQINQKLQTTGMEVCTTQLFFKHRNKAGNPKRAR